MQFAITEQKSVSSQVVGALLWYMDNIDSGIFTLPALAKESDPSQPFSGWILRQ